MKHDVDTVALIKEAADRLKMANDEVRSLRSDNARMSRAIAAYRRAEANLSPGVVVSLFALLGAGWPIALAEYVDRYGWDGAAAVLLLISLLWAVLLSVFMVKAAGK